MSLAPLAIGLALGFGVLIGAVLGPYEPSWGVAIAVPAVTALFAVGAVRERDMPVLALIVAVLIAATVGFVGTNAYVTVEGAAALVPPSAAAEVRRRVVSDLGPKWASIAIAVLVGAAGLAVRRWRRPKN